MVLEHYLKQRKIGLAIVCTCMLMLLCLKGQLIFELSQVLIPCDVNGGEREGGRERPRGTNAFMLCIIGVAAGCAMRRPRVGAIVPIEKESDLCGGVED